MPMDEKQPILAPVHMLADDELEQPRPRNNAHVAQRRRRRRVLLFTGIVALVVLLHTQLRNLSRAHDCVHRADGPHTYEGEKLAWERCGDVKGRLVECSTITVPLVFPSCLFSVPCRL